LALTGFAALAVVATELAIMFFGATLPTPLYPLYRLAFGFGGITLTLIYAVYVLGNLVALLFFGRLSDQTGRRPATLPAIGFGVASALTFLFADAAIWLFAARVLSGFATGLAAGAATAWIAELQPQGGKAVAASIASAANFAGLALAPLLAGALAYLRLGLCGFLTSST
jgi:MFS family permease